MLFLFGLLWVVCLIGCFPTVCCPGFSRNIGDKRKQNFTIERMTRKVMKSFSVLMLRSNQFYKPQTWEAFSHTSAQPFYLKSKESKAKRKLVVSGGCKSRNQRFYRCRFISLCFPFDLLLNFRFSSCERNTSMKILSFLT